MVGLHHLLLRSLALYDALANEMGTDVMCGLRASAWFAILSGPSLSSQGSKCQDGASLSDLISRAPVITCSVHVAWANKLCCLKTLRHLLLNHNLAHPD